MEDAFDDEAEQAVTIDEYLKEVEDRELVGVFPHFCFTFLPVRGVMNFCYLHWLSPI